MNKQGITLIALIITIIILLILAGISIQMIAGKNGILDMALSSKVKTERAALIEDIKLEIIDKTEERLGDLKKDDLYNILDKYFSNVPKVSESEDNPWNSYPKNFPDEKGVLIPRKEFGNYDDIKPEDVYDGIFSKENEPDKPSENPKLPGNPDKDGIFAKNSTVNGEEPSSDNPVIPSGFKPVDTETSKWDDPEDNVNKGLVIEDKAHNQFVWVPVPDPTKMFEEVDGRNVGKLYNYSSNPATEKQYTDNSVREPAKLKNESIDVLKDATGLEGSNEEVLEKWQEQLQNEFDAMKRSVSKYKGFWIGRYEAGNINNSSNKAPVIQAMNDDVQSGNFYGNYVNCKKFAEGKDGIISSMCYGSQWDATLNWFIRCGGDVEKKVFTDGYGNFSTSKFAYKDTDGTEKNKTSLGSKVLPTGCTEYSNINNIYDMAGNVSEYTLEVGSDSTRTVRGGNCGMSSGKVSGGLTDRGLGSKNGGPLYVGTRVTMFIEEN